MKIKQCLMQLSQSLAHQRSLLSNALFAAFTLLVMVSCKTPDLLLSADLKSDNMAYEVKGRQGVLINQVISFGPYTTSKIKRGWTMSYDIPFILRFQGSKERLSFSQFTSDSLKANVFCVGKLKSAEYEIIDDLFGIPVRYENTFSGSIVQTTANFWDFIIYNPDAGYGSGDYATSGFAKSRTGETIEIKPIKFLENHKGLKSIDNYGFEFSIENKAIAAVSIMNNGKVWMSKQIDPEHRLVLSALCSAILITSNLGQDFKSEY
ncbi:MAG: hypothetical protein MUF75_05775 [Bacteroidia bacterium]|jgi:hypothetical protein|nr:hypothetical protein [Bacteroidia bacterium]